MDKSTQTFKDQNLINIRPQIEFKEIHSNPIQSFQDKTLRPILKLQHDTILLVYHEFLNNHKIDFKRLTPLQRNIKIEISIKQNQPLQAMLKGMIIAYFTFDEITFWQLNKITINKRMQQLLIKRIQSTFIE